MTATAIATITATATPTANAIMRDFGINLIYFLVEKETFTQRKLSCKKHVKRNPEWWDNARQKIAWVEAENKAPPIPR